MKTNCPIPSCPCLTDGMMCATHWAMLPQPLKKELSRTYIKELRQGQAHKSAMELALAMIKRAEDRSTKSSRIFSSRIFTPPRR